MKLGPLPVEVTVDTEGSRLYLTHGEHEVDVTIDNPLALLVRLGLVLIAGAAPVSAPVARARRVERPAEKKCESCPDMVPVSSYGPIPRFCLKCRFPHHPKRKAGGPAKAAAPPTPPDASLEAALTPAEEIPESGSAFRARLKEAKQNGTLARRPNVIDTLRKRNEEIAARNGGRA